MDSTSHYLDEGPRDGPVVLCLHGEPTWSFLYRNMIPTLVQDGYRVIVPDFVGFGKSDKYSSPRNYTHEMHTMVLRLLIDQLELKDISLVCQDWGGLTGLSVVKDCPRLFSNLVIMNTGLPDGVINFEKGSPSTVLLRALPFLLWRSVVLVLGTWIPLKSVFSHAFKENKVSPSIIEGYTAPHPSTLYNGGVASWPLLVPLFMDDPVTPHMWEAKNFLKTWKKPVLLMFGDKDAITRGQENMFLGLTPHATFIPIKGAGHFLQETHGEELSTNIHKFIITNNKITKM
jgi:haloalkane dehalogenase